LMESFSGQDFLITTRASPFCLYLRKSAKSADGDLSADFAD
jgi:hypothetical protein